MRFLIFFMLMSCSAVGADADVVLAQKNTTLDSSFAFQYSQGGKQRVVSLLRPSSEHFFTFTDNKVFMNSVADGNQHLRLITFARNQFEIMPVEVTKDIPTAWNLTRAQEVLRQPALKLAQVEPESRGHRILLQTLSRQCGNVQVLGVLDDEKSYVRRYVVKVEGVGELETLDAIESVTCDDKTLLVGTLYCYGEGLPCSQTLLGVQFENDGNSLTDNDILDAVYGGFDAKEFFGIEGDTDEKLSYVPRVLLTRYVELGAYKLLYTVTAVVPDRDDSPFCNLCSLDGVISIFMQSENGWEMLYTPENYSIYGLPADTFYMDHIGNDEIGLILSSDTSRQGEGSMRFEVYWLAEDGFKHALSFHEYYEFSEMCEFKQNSYANLEFFGDNRLRDIKILTGHYDPQTDCGKRKFLQQESVYRFNTNKYELMPPAESAHHSGR